MIDSFLFMINIYILRVPDECLSSNTSFALTLISQFYNVYVKLLTADMIIKYELAVIIYISVIKLSYLILQSNARYYYNLIQYIALYIGGEYSTPPF